MKRREDGKRECGDRPQPESFASDAAVRAGDFDSVRLLEPPKARRPREIYRVVALPFPADRGGHRLGDVPVLAAKRTRISRLNWQKISNASLANRAGRVSSVVG